MRIKLLFNNIFCNMLTSDILCFLFFFNDTATTEIYTLSLHDALPISAERRAQTYPGRACEANGRQSPCPPPGNGRSEEHTSELQSLAYLVCRLLLEKKKKRKEQIFKLAHCAVQSSYTKRYSYRKCPEQ